MFNPLIYFWIRRQAKELQMKIPLNYVDIICKYQHIEKPSTDKIVFSRLVTNSKCLSASAALKGKIIFNAEWAARIALFDNDETMNAFKASVGHELTHKDEEMNTFDKSHYARVFKKRANEVHADFGAAAKMLNNSRECAIRACKYKKNHKSKDKNKKHSGHPSWKQRLNYISNYNFNKELIRIIAEDMNFKNQRVINYVSTFYEDIVLK